LLPPSNHASGGVYLDEILHPLFDTPLAPMPTWLRALVTSTTSGNGAGAPHDTETDWGTLLAGAPEGQRREVALKITGHYLGKRLPEAEVLSILRGFAVQCVPPFPERECRELVRDLARRDRAKASATTDGQPHLGEDRRPIFRSSSQRSSTWSSTSRPPRVSALRSRPRCC
jgi:hypothetical protein